MRHIVSFAAIGLCLAYAGCAQAPGGGLRVAAPTPEQIAAGEKLVTAAVCAVPPLAQTARGVARRKVRGGGSLGGSSATQIIGTINVASTALCGALGGIFQGNTAVPASQVTPVAPTAK